MRDDISPTNSDDWPPPSFWRSFIPMRVRIAIGFWLYRTFILPGQLVTLYVPSLSDSYQKSGEREACEDFVKRKRLYQKNSAK